MTARAVPFHCPYCGEEDLHPREEHGAWECHACLRAFTVSFVGQLRPPASVTAARRDDATGGAR